MTIRDLQKASSSIRSSAVRKYLQGEIERRRNVVATMAQRHALWYRNLDHAAALRVAGLEPNSPLATTPELMAVYVETFNATRAASLALAS